MGVRLSNYRRVIQAFFFLLFLVLLAITAKQISLPFPTELFLVADPLIALVTLLSGLPFRYEMLFALITVGVTLVWGRIFCGYACPMGAFLDLFAPLSRVLKLKRGSFKRLKTLPVITLAIVLVMSAFGINILMVLDPLAMITRTTTVTIFPGIDYVLSTIADSLYTNRNIAPVVDRTVWKLSGILVHSGQRTFLSAQWMIILFAFVVSLNALGNRFWCRYVCPLGGLLGIIGRAPLYRRKVAAESCSSCLKCAKSCTMEAVSADGLTTDAASCVLCLKCKNNCPQGAISVDLKPELSNPMPSRRTAIATVGATMVAAYTVPLSKWPEPDELTLLRPPGALKESAFLDKCIRCGACLKACPTNVLQPSLLQYGVEAVWTPYLDFNVSVCDWSCNACGKVCPTGAIEHLKLKAKQKFVIGVAEIDRGKCIPWIAGHGCGVCVELCPLPDKAIIIEERPTDYGKMAVLPIVVKEKCIGCGICEKKCPLPRRKAIKIFPTKFEGGQDLFYTLDNRDDMG